MNQKPKLNSEFSTINFVDLKITIHNESGLINYTKLCKDLKCSDNNNHFKNMVTSNRRIWDIIILYENNDNLINYPRSIKTLVDLGIFKMFLNGVSPKYFGTYGPSYLFNYVVMMANINYYKYLNNYTFGNDINNYEIMKLKYEKQKLKLDNEIKQLKLIIEKYNSINCTGIEYGYE